MESRDESVACECGKEIHPCYKSAGVCEDCLSDITFRYHGTSQLPRLSTEPKWKKSYADFSEKFCFKDDYERAIETLSSLLNLSKDDVYLQYVCRLAADGGSTRTLKQWENSWIGCKNIDLARLNAAVKNDKSC